MTNKSNRSLWGALTCFVIANIIDFFIFESFIFYYYNYHSFSQQAWLPVLCLTVLLLHFFTLQRTVIITAEQALQARKNNNTKIASELSPKTFDEYLKLFLFFITTAIWIALLSGFNPLPHATYKNSSIFLISFYLSTWIISFIISRKKINAFPRYYRLNYFLTCIVAILFGSFLISKTIHDSYAFYMGGIMGIPVILYPICELLTQTKKNVSKVEFKIEHPGRT